MDAKGNMIWEKTYNNERTECGLVVRQTKDGGYIMGGYANVPKKKKIIAPDNRKIEGGSVLPDFYIIKVDSDGNKEWDKYIGGLGSDQCELAMETADGGYLFVGKMDTGDYSDYLRYDYTGNINYDIYAVKTDTDGNIEWEKAYGKSLRDYPNFIRNTMDGGILVAGVAANDTEGWSISGDTYIFKISSSGNIEWEKTFGGYSADTADVAYQSNDGTYIVFGHENTTGYRIGTGHFYLLQLGHSKPGQEPPVKVLLNGNALNSDVAPVVKNGRTLVPIRPIAEGLGVKVEWSEERQTAFLIKGENVINLDGAHYLTRSNL